MLVERSLAAHCSVHCVYVGEVTQANGFRATVDVSNFPCRHAESEPGCWDSFVTAETTFIEWRHASAQRKNVSPSSAQHCVQRLGIPPRAGVELRCFASRVELSVQRATYVLHASMVGVARTTAASRMDTRFMTRASRRRATHRTPPLAPCLDPSCWIPRPSRQPPLPHMAMR